jgi:hypothetical protein
MTGAVSPVHRKLTQLGLIVATLLVVPVAASAQETSPAAPTGDATSLTVEFVPSTVKGVPHYLTARLTASNGSAVAGEQIRFVRHADIFGGRKVELGRATTDSGGVARVAIVPRETSYEVTASFAGIESLEGSVVEQEVVFPPETVVTGARPPHGGGLVDPHLRPLAEVMPGVIGSAALIVWAVLVFVALGTLWRVRRDGDRGNPTPPGVGTRSGALDGDPAVTGSERPEP